MKNILPGLLTILFFLNTLQAQELSDNDIIEISKLVSNKRIIGLGEEEHFYLESNKNRIEIIRKLIKKRLINSIVFETSGTDVFVVNEYIHHRVNKTTLLASLQQFKKLNAGPFFDSNEIFSFIEWLKNINAGTYDIEVYGMDFYDYISAIQNLQQTRQHNELQNSFDKIRQTFNTLTNYLHNNPSRLAGDDIKKKSAENLSMVKEVISKLSPSFASVSEEYSANELYNYSYWFTDINNRDSLMFANFTGIDNGKKNYTNWKFIIDQNNKFQIRIMPLVYK